MPANCWRSSLWSTKRDWCHGRTATGPLPRWPDDHNASNTAKYIIIQHEPHHEQWMHRCHHHITDYALRAKFHNEWEIHQKFCKRFVTLPSSKSLLNVHCRIAKLLYVWALIGKTLWVYDSDSGRRTPIPLGDYDRMSASRYLINGTRKKMLGHGTLCEQSSIRCHDEISVKGSPEQSHHRCYGMEHNYVNRIIICSIVPLLQTNANQFWIWLMMIAR